jgi:hypothetical protein
LSLARADADVVRVTTLRAAFAEANEIRCVKIVRSQAAPVDMNLDDASGDATYPHEVRRVARRYLSNEVVPQNVYLPAIERRAFPDIAYAITGNEQNYLVIALSSGIETETHGSRATGDLLPPPLRPGRQLAAAGFLVERLVENWAFLIA